MKGKEREEGGETWEMGEGRLGPALTKS